MSARLALALLATIALTPCALSVEPDPATLLPGDIVPHHYKISILTNSEQLIFNGTVDIEVECKEATDTVKLHSLDLDIVEKDVFIKKVEDEKKISAVNIGYDKDYNHYFIIIKFAEKLDSGSKYLLHIPFGRAFSDGMLGFYKSSYEDKKNGKTKWLFSTKFMPVDARRAFPCFDEPMLKANFSLRLGHEDHLKAISNMPICNTYKEGNIVWDEFQESPPMSAHIVGFTLAEFGVKESKEKPNGVTFSVWARSESLNELEFATQYGPKLLNYFNEYYKIPYPLPKLDFVVMPTYGSGSVENWGAVPIRESFLMGSGYGPAMQIAFNLAHQWFGDLVSVKWWTDWWFTSNFASYLCGHALEHVFPEWNVLNIEIASYFLSLLTPDALVSSHRALPTNADPYDTFHGEDPISSKGGILFYMLNSFLGADVFQEGVNKYLTKYSYSNADHDDFYSSLTSAAEGKNLLPSGVTVKAFMDNWTLQPGYPLLTVKREGSTITVSQERFFINNPKAEEKKKSRWYVPVTFSTAKNPNFANIKTSHWLSCDDSELTVDTGAAADDWIILNNKASGYYRVNYDGHTWNLLADALHSPKSSQIPELNKFLLVADAFVLASSGLLDYPTAMRVCSYIKKETDYVPWLAVDDALSDLEKKLLRTDKYDEFQNLIQSLFSNICDKCKDLNSVPNSYPESRLKRLVLSWAIKYDVGQVTETAAALFNKWKSTNKNTIVPELKKAVYCAGVKQGGEEEWNFVWQQIQATTNPSEKWQLIGALGCSKDENLLKKSLEYSLDESKVSKEFAVDVFVSVAEKSKLGYDVAKPYLIENLEKIHQYLLPNTDHFSYYLTAILEQLISQEEIEDMKKLVASNQKVLSFYHVQVDQALEKSQNNVEWLARCNEGLTTALSEYK